MQYQHQQPGAQHQFGAQYQQPGVQQLRPQHQHPGSQHQQPRAQHQPGARQLINNEDTLDRIAKLPQQTASELLIDQFFNGLKWIVV